MAQAQRKVATACEAHQRVGDLHKQLLRGVRIAGVHVFQGGLDVVPSRHRPNPVARDHGLAVLYLIQDGSLQPWKEHPDPAVAKWPVRNEPFRLLQTSERAAELLMEALAFLDRRAGAPAPRKRSQHVVGVVVEDAVKFPAI